MLLSEENLSQHLHLAELALNPQKFTKQAFSDLVRINLLAQHGGVWLTPPAFVAFLSIHGWTGILGPAFCLQQARL